jgi:hypothetical protein
MRGAMLALSLALHVATVPALLDAAALRAESAAAAATAGDFVTVLREELDVRVEGREWTRTSRLIYRIEDARAIDGWGHISSSTRHGRRSGRP